MHEPYADGEPRQDQLPVLIHEARDERQRRRQRQADGEQDAPVVEIGEQPDRNCSDTVDHDERWSCQ